MSPTDVTESSAPDHGDASREENAYAPQSGMARTAKILQFLLKYRNAGVFNGLDLDAATAEHDVEVPTEGKPEQFVTDL